MFSQVEELLPVISFGSKKDGESEKKHAEFVDRMAARGYTERQVRRLVEWYMRVKQAGEKAPSEQAIFMHIVDRRLNPSGKNLANRQRFMRRAKSLIRKAVHESSASRSIKDADQAGEVALPAQGVHEPSLHRSASGGVRDHLLPGNKQYIEGDTIPRPQGGAGGGGSEGSPDGDGQDDFRFALSRDEFVDLFLEDLELPDLAKRRVVDAESVTWHRAGYSVSGSPANLALLRTVRNSLSRRIALKRPKPHELQQLRDEIAALSPDGEESARRLELEEELTRKLRRSGLIPYIDPLDVRYRLFTPQPKPVAQAVMFCLMDVSGSMTEHMKDLAKRFYVLLYIFLRRRYKHVDVVFIRHTHQAQEVDEETFFQLARDRRYRGVHRAGGDAGHRRRALQSGLVEHLCGTGLGRRQHGIRQRQDCGAADRQHPAGLPVLRLSRGRP